MPRKKKDTAEITETANLTSSDETLLDPSETASDPESQTTTKRRSRKDSEPKTNEAPQDIQDTKSKRRPRKKMTDADSSAEEPQEAAPSANLMPTESTQTESVSSSQENVTPTESGETVRPRAAFSSKSLFLNLFASNVHSETLPKVKEGTVITSEEVKHIQEISAPVNPANTMANMNEDGEPSPFIPKTLAWVRIWPGTSPMLDYQMLMNFREDIAFSEADKPHTNGILNREAAEFIRNNLDREIMYPAGRRDFSPRVLESFSEEQLKDILESDDSLITAKAMHRLETYLLETIAPNHIASRLVGGAYTFELPMIEPDPVIDPQPRLEITENGIVNSSEENLDALFAELATPVTAFDYSDFGGEKDALAYTHTVNHCGRIMAHIKHWALHLRQIDQEAKRPSDQMPLAHVYYSRFVELLGVDMRTAYENEIILPDDRLKNRFNLDEMDLFILWLVASLQIDQDVRECLVPTWTQGSIIVITPATIMRFVTTNQMEKSEILFRLSTSSRLQTLGLLRSTFTRNPILPLYFELTVPEQISLQFAGTLSLSTSVAKYASLTYPSLSKDTFLSPEHKRTLSIVRHFVTRPALNQTNDQLSRENLNFIPSLPFLIEGLPGSGRTTLMKIIASRLELPLIIVNCGALSMLPPEEFSNFFHDLFFDAELLNALVCLKEASMILTEPRYVSLFTRQLSMHPIVCALCVDLPQTITPELDPYVTFKTKMDANLKENAVEYWKPHLSLPFANNLHVDVLDLSRKLALQPFQIQKATRLAYYATANEDERENEEDMAVNDGDIFLSNQILERAAGAQITKNIGNLAFITDPEVTLNDVIVSDDIMKKIKQIIGSAQNRRRVLYEWGLSKRIRRGTGVICLFDGDPGTGKTHSAEAIAKSLGLSLMRVNIASMVDKYIGETEKNLTKIFEQARPDMSLLLFDEADSLFTKRTSNVSKSNDRYSNMSVNVLLQLVERYEGVSVLTTNLKNSIDPAFERRITYKIYFPMPKKEERIRLWKYMCPPDVVTAEPLDYEWLGEIEMSGGEIKNAVLAGAFRAATMGRLLDTEILYDAGVTEASAAGRVMRHYDEDDDGFN